jgi:hypothetical protein
MYCGDPVRVQRVQDVLKRVTGQDWTVRVETTAARNGRSDQPAVQESRAAPPAAAADVLRQPLVEQVVAVLGGKLLQMDDGFGTAVEAGPAEAAAELTDTEEG